MSSDPWSVHLRPSAEVREMGDVVFSLGEHEVACRRGERRTYPRPTMPEKIGLLGIAGPVNAIARGGMAQRHRRRPVDRRSRCTKGDMFHRRRPGCSPARGSCGPRCRGRCRRRPGSQGSASRRPNARRRASGRTGRARLVACGCQQDRKQSEPDQGESTRAMRPRIIVVSFSMLTDIGVSNSCRSRRARVRRSRPSLDDPSSYLALIVICDGTLNQ